MKYLLLVTALLTSSSAFAWGTHTVKGHVRSNGTYVSPYIRSNPDKSIYNNLGTTPKPRTYR